MEFSVVAIWVGCSQETILKKVTFVQKPEGSESRKRKRFFSSDGRVGRSVKLGQSEQGEQGEMGQGLVNFVRTWLYSNDLRSQ